MPARKTPTKNPAVALVKGIQDKEEFAKNWRSAEWLTDPLKRALEDQEDLLIKSLIDGDNSPTQDAYDKGAINTLRYIRSLLP